jgi:nucleotide-binding universal stress UspA family protein
MTVKALICSIGSKRRAATLRFGVEIAGALLAETTLLGIVKRQGEVERLQRLLDQAALDLAGREVPVEVRVEVGSAENLLLSEVEGTTYDLVALGSLAGKRSPGALFEPLGMRLLERAQGSVLLIKGERPRLSRILICSSGTEHGRMAVWAGTALACAAEASATLLHVVDLMPAMYTGLQRMEETLAELLDSGTDMARELRWAAQVIKAECDISEVMLRRGIVADEIVKESEVGDYDLIVLGSSRSAGGLVRALMGDVTHKVVNLVERPVLVVRPSSA